MPPPVTMKHRIFILMMYFLTGCGLTCLQALTGLLDDRSHLLHRGIVADRSGSNWHYMVRDEPCRSVAILVPALYHSSGSDGDDPAWLISIVHRDGIDFKQHVAMAAGWPVRCFVGIALLEDSVIRSNSSLAVLDRRGFIDATRVRGVPMTPLWGTFILHAICVAILLKGARSVAAWPRRFLRARAGRCMQCGFDLRGSRGRRVCPECGRTLTTHGSTRGGV